MAARNTEAAVVSRVLARGGRRPLPSGTPYSRQGLRVKRSTHCLAIVVADYDHASEASDALADAAEILRRAGYAVDRTEGSVVMRVTQPSGFAEPLPTAECPMCGWTVGTNPSNCGECAATPDDFEIQPIDPDDPTAVDPATCGTCGLTWDDGVSTSWTPAPSGRCPFEYFHEEEM